MLDEVVEIHMDIPLFWGTPPKGGARSTKTRTVPTRRVPQRSLNATVAAQMDDVPLKKLPRDLNRFDKSDIAVELVRTLPRRLREDLGREVVTAPYSAHAAWAIIQSRHLGDWDATDAAERLYAEQAVATLRWSTIKEAVESFGQKETHQAVQWMAQELHARRMVFGTKSMFPYQSFLATLARYRRILGARPQAPDDWEGIISALIRGGALRMTHYHRARGKDFASFSF